MSPHHHFNSFRNCSLHHGKHASSERLDIVLNARKMGSSKTRRRRKPRNRIRSYYIARCNFIIVIIVDLTRLFLRYFPRHEARYSTRSKEEEKEMDAAFCAVVCLTDGQLLSVECARFTGGVHFLPFTIIVAAVVVTTLRKVH